MKLAEKMAGDDLDEEEEDVWHNPVFLSLRERVKDFEQLACEYGWLILVPQSSSLGKEQHAEFTITFLKKHVVFPSPYLRDEFVNFSGDRVVIENGVVTMKSGWNGHGDSGKKIKILFEEACYGKFGSYKAICIASPLPSLQDIAASWQQNGLPKFPEDGTPVFDENRSVDEWMFILNRDKKNSEGLRYLEEFVENLKSSYVLVANEVGITGFMQKISTGVEKGLDLVINGNHHRFGIAASNKRLRLMLRRALEAYTFMGLHDMVFDHGLVPYYRDQEFALKEKCKMKREEANLTVLVKNSLNFFEDLNKLRCPLAKLEFLRDYLAISEFTLNADNILSTLVERILNVPETSDVYVLANLQYIRRFAPCQTPPDLVYLASQYHAAVCFVMDVDLEEFHKSGRLLLHPDLLDSVRSGVRDSNYESTYSTPRSRNSDEPYSYYFDSRPSSASGRGGSLSPMHSNIEALEEIMAAQLNDFQQSETTPKQQDDEETSSGEDEDDEDDDEQEQDHTLSSFSRNNDESKLGGFLFALKQCNADVVTSSSSSTPF